MSLCWSFATIFALVGGPLIAAKHAEVSSGVIADGASEERRTTFFRKENTDTLSVESNSAFLQSASKTAPPQISGTVQDFNSVLVTIGSSELREKCVRTGESVACAANAGDPDLRRNVAAGNELFDITVSGGNVLCARRVDKAVGWGMELVVACSRLAVQTVDVGPSLDNKKCLDLEERVACSWNAANAGIRYNEDAPDTIEGYSFVVSALPTTFDSGLVGTRVCVTRMDSTLEKGGQGWPLNLRIGCSLVDQSFSYKALMADIHGGQPDNTNCLTWPHRVQGASCPINAAALSMLSWKPSLSSSKLDSAEASVPLFEVVADHAFQNPDSGARICARRVDSTNGWDRLTVKCNGMGAVTIGESLERIKCITLDQPVTCFPSAGDKDYRLNFETTSDEFQVTTSGNHVCVRRVDADEGWTMKLVIACNPLIGYAPSALGHAGAVLAAGSSRRRREPWMKSMGYDVEDPNEANAILEGSIVWLEHAHHKWFGCPNFDECLADSRQAPDQFRLFKGKQSVGPLKSGDSVFIRHERSSMFIGCDRKCAAKSGCPGDSEANELQESKFTGCSEEEFVIFSASAASTGSLPLIRDGDTVWLQSRGSFLSCRRAGEPCSADGVCAGSADRRAYLSDLALQCRAERFRIYAASVGSAHLPVKTDQAVMFSFGASADVEKCLSGKGFPVTCAEDAGDFGKRASLSPKGDESTEVKFSVYVRAAASTAFDYEVCAKRVDAAMGWHFNLTLSCDVRNAAPLWPRDIPTIALGYSAVSRVVPLPPIDSEVSRRHYEPETPTLALGPLAEIEHSPSLGGKHCQCIDAQVGGVATVGGVGVFFGQDVGAKCAAWDDGKYPGSCEDESQNPGTGKGWCAKAWCYVDPCNCDLAAAPKSTGEHSYFPGVTYKGMALHQSYETCNASTQEVLSPCQSYLDGGSCNSNSDCGWSGTRCVQKRFALMCSVVNVIVAKPISVLFGLNGINVNKFMKDDILRGAFERSIRSVVAGSARNGVQEKHVIIRPADAPNGESKASLVVEAYLSPPLDANSNSVLASLSTGNLATAILAGLDLVTGIDAVSENRNISFLRIALGQVQDDCKSAIWRKPADCVDEFKYRGKVHTGCLENDIYGEPAWCSTTKVLTDFNTQTRECTKASCAIKFDCQAEKDIWEVAWSIAKKEYCCTTQGIGCIPANLKAVVAANNTTLFVVTDTKPQFDGVCQLPHSDCASSFIINGKRYDNGCALVGGRNACGTAMAPASSNGPSQIRECTNIPCTQLCFDKHPKCKETFNFLGSVQSDCIRSDPPSHAWCSLSQNWSDADIGVGNFAWCKPRTCEQHCWVPAPECAQSFLFKGSRVKGCYVEASGQNAWCSTLRSGTSALTTAEQLGSRVYCRKTSCPGKVEHSISEDSLEVFKAENFDYLGKGSCAEMGTPSKADSLEACIHACAIVGWCQSFTFAPGDSQDRNCELKICMLHPNRCSKLDKVCDKSVTYVRTGASSGPVMGEQGATLANASEMGGTAPFARSNYSLKRWNRARGQIMAGRQGPQAKEKPAPPPVLEGQVWPKKKAIQVSAEELKAARKKKALQTGRPSVAAGLQQVERPEPLATYQKAYGKMASSSRRQVLQPQPDAGNTELKDGYDPSS